jgi:DNA replicative helicase MCM subunit Mcm2 (Cdc46/Mcm family)
MCRPRHRFILRNTGDISTGTTHYQLPMECPSNLDASSTRPCIGSNFLPQDGPGATVYTNHQELRVQEQMQCLEPGSVPASISVTLQDELADRCQPGGELAVPGQP